MHALAADLGSGYGGGVDRFHSFGEIMVFVVGGCTDLDFAECVLIGAVDCVHGVHCLPDFFLDVATEFVANPVHLRPAFFQVCSEGNYGAGECGCRVDCEISV